MINKQKILDKMDKVVDLYFASKEIDLDDSFRTNLINYSPEIHVFSSILDLSEATGIEITISPRERSIEYKGVRFFECRDLTKEIEELENRLKR